MSLGFTGSPILLRHRGLGLGLGLEMEVEVEMEVGGVSPCLPRPPRPPLDQGLQTGDDAICGIGQEGPCQRVLSRLER